MPINTFAKLVGKEELVSNIFKFSVESKELADLTKPGQFLEIRVTDNLDPFLRRPISVYNINKEKGLVEFIFQVKGKGTVILAEKKVGDTIDILGPLGYGTFKYEKYDKIAIIGGGIGVFPLYELAKQAKERNLEVNTYLGFRNKDLVVLEKEFEEVSTRLELTTDDGSYAKKGFSINALKEDIQKEKPDCIYACGPLPLLKAVKELAIQNDIDCQISLEERMGCGVGACLGCAVKKAGEDTYVHVCKLGPVFDAKEVEI